MNTTPETIPTPEMVYIESNWRGDERHIIASMEYEEIEPGHFVPFCIETVTRHQPKAGPEKWVPHSWDVEYCKRYAASYFHYSGGGGESVLHIHECVSTAGPNRIWFDRSLLTPVGYKGGYAPGREPEPLTDAEIEAMGYKVLPGPLPLFGKDLLYPFEDTWNMREGTTVCCAECNDNLPCGETNYPCAHVWWCHVCAWWTGAVDDACDHPRGAEEDA